MKLNKNFPLAPFSTFGIGGKAEFFYQAKNTAEIIEAIQLAKKNKIAARVFGSGSNIVFPDKTLKGLTIQIKNGNFFIEKNKIIAEAGCSLKDIIVASINKSFSGLEKLSGIPGTIAGAAVGNAGAYGASISQTIKRIEIFNVNNGKIFWLSKKDCKFAYRESIFKQSKNKFLILRIEFQFKKKNSCKLLKKISQEIIAIRNKKFPPNLRCPGSFFKNIPINEILPKIQTKIMAKIDPARIINNKIPAGYLLEQVGAKGLRHGGLRVSNFHANIIENIEGATFQNVKTLSTLLKKRVKRKFGLEIEREVRYMHKFRNI